MHQSWRAHVRGGEAVAARALDEGGRQPGFPDPGRAGDQEIGVVPNPPASAEAQDHVAAQSARRTEVDVFERRRIAKLRSSQALRESTLFARGPFRVDEQAEAVVKPKLRVLTRAPLLVKRRGHRRQV